MRGAAPLPRRDHPRLSHQRPAAHQPAGALWRLRAQLRCVVRSQSDAGARLRLAALGAHGVADNILKLASYSAQAQEDVWGKDPTAKLSNCVTPVGKGRPVDGGAIWSGRHTFSSGVDHADWVLAAGVIDHGDRKQACSVLVPKSDITIVDDWHVIGLAGTGSKTFVIDEKFVPEHRILDKKVSDEGNAPGAHLMPRRCSTCRVAARRPPAIARLPWESRRAASRPITSTRGRGNRAAGRCADGGRADRRGDRRSRNRGRGAHVSGRAARGDGRAGAEGAYGRKKRDPNPARACPGQWGPCGTRSFQPEES